MLNYWSDHNQKVYLPSLFGYLKYQKVAVEDSFLVYKKASSFYVIIKTVGGFMYYKTEHPENKLQASDIFEEHVSKVEGNKNKGIWGKIHTAYTEYLENESEIISEVNKINLSIVDLDFNHFKSGTTPFKSSLNGNINNLYVGLEDDSYFKNRLFFNAENKIQFPLYNNSNELSGYLIDDDKKVIKDKYTNSLTSIWFSNIPNKIDSIIVFKNPKEAISFHRKFNLKNVVYISLSEINYETSQILLSIKKVTKVKKIVISFTGINKIEGYLRDLYFISYLSQDNFDVSILENYISIVFKIGKEKKFIKYYKKIQEYNVEMTKDFVSYNKVANQHKINKYLIRLIKEDDIIKVKIPIEVNAIKFSVWNYFKHYLEDILDILKPDKFNWENEFIEDQTSKLKANETTNPEKYRIAQ